MAKEWRCKIWKTGYQQGMQLNEIIPCRWVHDQKGPSLHSSSMGPRDQKLTLRCRTQRPTRCQNLHWAAEVTEVREGIVKDTPGDHRSNTTLYPLRERQPMYYIMHVGSDRRKLGQFLIFYNASSTLLIHILDHSQTTTAIKVIVNMVKNLTGHQLFSLNGQTYLDIL